MSRVNLDYDYSSESFEPMSKIRNASHSNLDKLYTAKPTEILANLRLGRISIDHAIDFLDRNEGIALLWAGELAVEKALELKDIESVANTLVQAKSLFDRSQSIEFRRHGANTNHIVARAKIFNTNLPLFGRVLTGGLLPNEKLANNIYAKSLAVGLELSERYSKMRNSDPETHQVSSFLGKIAIQSLLQRDSLISGSTLDNFPVLSLLSSHTLDKNKTNRDSVWDIDVLANQQGGTNQLGKIGPISREFKVRVHTVPNKFFEEVPVNEDIKVVNISPNLKLGTDYSFGISSGIIDDCWQELQNQSGPDFISNRLDTRTTLLKQTLQKQAA